MAFAVSAAVTALSFHCGTSWAKNWDRFPMVVTPAFSAWMVLSVDAGNPIIKSPMCGWIGTVCPTCFQSFVDSNMGPVSAGMFFRCAFGNPMRRSRQIPARSTMNPFSSAVLSSSANAAAVEFHEFIPMWA